MESPPLFELEACMDDDPDLRVRFQQQQDEMSKYGVLLQHIIQEQESQRIALHRECSSWAVGGALSG